MTNSSATNKYWYKGLPTYRADGDGPQGGYFYTKAGARYYDAQFGRFITRDTDLNEKPYVYCNDDPVNAVDPDGHGFFSSITHFLQQISKVINQILQIINVLSPPKKTPAPTPPTTPIMNGRRRLFDASILRDEEESRNTKRYKGRIVKHNWNTTGH